MSRQGIYNLAMVVMVNNTIEYDEYRYGERHDSIISAIRSFASKFSGALNQGIVSLILIVSGIYAISQNISDLEVQVGNGTLTSENALIAADQFIAEVSTHQTLLLRIGMVFVPLLMMSVAFLIILRKYKIDESMYKKMVTEIASRKDTAHEA